MRASAAAGGDDGMPCGGAEGGRTPRRKEDRKRREDPDWRLGRRTGGRWIVQGDNAGLGQGAEAEAKAVSGCALCARLSPVLGERTRWAAERGR